MASKNIIYKVDNKPTKELIEKLNDDRDVFFRFQNPYQKLTKRSKSWGMIYQSEREARSDYKSMDLDPDDAILNGKSCMDTLEGLYDWIDQFDKDYVVLAFYGSDTGETGHDEEYVCTYCGKVAVFNFKDVVEYMENKEEAKEVA